MKNENHPDQFSLALLVNVHASIFTRLAAKSVLVFFSLLVFLLYCHPVKADYPANCCAKSLVCLQVLGSGGPEINDKRASSAYLIWLRGHARILVDMGPGSLLRFEESGARVEDLQVILLSHLHVDHSADLPGLLKASYFSGRTQDLPLYGPEGNDLMPDTKRFVQSLFAYPEGAYRYLSDYLTGKESYRLLAYNIATENLLVRSILQTADFSISTAPVHHGPLPALAWRIDAGNKSIVFSGDMNGDNHMLEKLANDANVLVAHHAIAEQSGNVARSLHMPPSVIGQIADSAAVKRLILSHRMTRTVAQEEESAAFIRKAYAGPLEFAEDGQCYPVE